MVAIALQPALGFFCSVLPRATHGPVLIHQTEQVSADAPEQGNLFHRFRLATGPQACNRSATKEGPRKSLAGVGSRPIEGSLCYDVFRLGNDF